MKGCSIFLFVLKKTLKINHTSFSWSMVNAALRWSSIHIYKLLWPCLILQPSSINCSMTRVLRAIYFTGNHDGLFSHLRSSQSSLIGPTIFWAVKQSLFLKTPPEKWKTVGSSCLTGLAGTMCGLQEASPLHDITRKKKEKYISSCGFTPSYSPRIFWFGLSPTR